MSDVLCAVLTFYVDTSGTSVSKYVTAGREYLGANRPGVFLPVVQEFVNLQIDAFDDGTTFGEVAVGGGVLTLANPAGALDGWLTYGGGTAALYILASESADWNSKTALLVADIEVLEDDGNGSLTVRLKDGRALTDVPFETAFYAGTNAGATGLEGTAEDLKGKPKVNALGHVFQAPVPWANTSKQIVQLDKIRINDIADGKIYDGLVALTRGAAKASVAALVAATPAPGTFDYYLGGSGDGAYAMLGTTPKYTVTADIAGQARGGTFRTKPGDLWQEALTQRAGIPSGSVSSADVTAINAAAPYDLGLWLDEPTAVKDVCNRIARSILGFWGRDQSGMFRLFQLVDPAGQTPLAAFKPFLPRETAKNTDGDIISLERLAPNDRGSGAPAAEITVRYRRYALTQDLGFDVNAPLALRAAAKDEYRVAKPSAPLVNWRAKYPLAPSLEFETDLVNEADAVAIADKAAALFSVEGRTRYRVTLRMTSAVAAGLGLGATVRLIYPRWGLDAGKNALILGMRYRGFTSAQSGEILQCNLFV